MSYKNDKFRRARRDFSPYLFHFIKGADTEPLNTLQTILRDLKLKSKLGYICFSASPLTSITKFFETPVIKTGSPMYHPYGIGFLRDTMVSDYGARNVIYYSDDEEEMITDNLKWRSQLLNVDSYDFEYLREWRIKGNEFCFKDFPKEDIIIVAPNDTNQEGLALEFEIEFKPIVNYATGDIEPDWEEKLIRKWKGVSISDIKDCDDDFAMSALTNKQVIGQDLLAE